MRPSTPIAAAGCRGACILSLNGESTTPIGRITSAGVSSASSSAALIAGGHYSAFPPAQSKPSTTPHSIFTQARRNGLRSARWHSHPPEPLPPSRTPSPALHSACAPASPASPRAPCVAHLYACIPPKLLLATLRGAAVLEAASAIAPANTPSSVLLTQVAQVAQSSQLQPQSSRTTNHTLILFPNSPAADKLQLSPVEW